MIEVVVMTKNDETNVLHDYGIYKAREGFFWLAVVSGVIFFNHSSKVTFVSQYTIYTLYSMHYTYTQLKKMYS